MPTETTHRETFDERIVKRMNDKHDHSNWKFLTRDKYDSIILRLEELTAGTAKKTSRDRRLESRFSVMREVNTQNK